MTHDYGLCETCQRPVYSVRRLICTPCYEADVAARKLAPVVVHHIAGYVPPKGSIARELFGHVVKYS